MRASALRRVGVGGRWVARGVLLPLLRGAGGFLRGLVPKPSAPIFWLCVNLWILHAGRRAWRRARMLALVRMIKDLSKEDIKFMLGHLPMWIKDGDYESVRWLNSGLAEMWPQMNRMICRLLKNRLEPIINARLPENVSRINFKELDLGAMAPVITGVKPVTNQHLECGLDIELKWGGCPRVLLQLEPSKGRSLPAELMGRIVENIMYVSIDSIIVEGRLRLFFTPLVNNIVVGGLRMQLPERPMLDFNLSSYGMNIMSMPAVSQLLRRSIEETALGRMTWPKDINFKWCSDANKAQSWSSTGSLPVGLLQIELLECHVVNRSSKAKQWSPYVVTTTSRKSRKAQVSRSATARKTSRFMMSHNQTVVVRPKDIDEAIRLVVLHDSGWSSLDYDLPLAILDIPLSQVIASAAPSPATPPQGSRNASSGTAHPPLPRGGASVHPHRRSMDSPTGEPSNRSSLSAPAAPEDQLQEPKRWSMDGGDKHQQQMHHAMSYPEKVAALTAAAPPSATGSPSAPPASAFHLDRDETGSSSHHPTPNKATRGPSIAHTLTHPRHKDGDKAKGKGKHKGFEWWDPLTWAGHQHSEASPADTSHRHASSSSVFENLFAGGHHSHSHKKGKKQSSLAKPDRPGSMRSSSAGSSTQRNRRNKQIISPFLSDEDDSDEEHECAGGLEALFQPEGGWLPMNPLGSFTPLQLGAEVTLRTMQDYVSAVQDIATTGTVTATEKVMGGLKKVGDEVGSAFNMKTKGEKICEDKPPLHSSSPTRTKPVHKPATRALQALKRSNSNPNVASLVQSLGLEPLPPGPLDDGALLRSRSIVNDMQPPARRLDGALGSSKGEDGASSSSGPHEHHQGPNKIALLHKPRNEWSLYHQSCLQHGKRVSNANSLIHALAPARGWLQIPTAAGMRQSRDSKETPLVAHSGCRWAMEGNKELSYIERPGVMKMRLTFYPTLLREPTPKDVVSPMGTLLVYVSQLRYQNLQLKEPLVMLRVDEQLLWTRAATAKNGLVSFDEEVAFPLERRQAEFKRLEVLVVEDQSTLHKLLHNSLGDAEVSCGVNIQLQNAIVRTASKGSWPVYDLRTNRSAGMAGLSDHGARVNCGDISLHMKWLLTAVV